ncbi:hypothetical protein C4D60_Mb01t05990 [Musa balbisiana]|uniref:Uncharacterized protein n=1 Tax=Musa balbisiana TaxID=52838 RepID=A0A4S8JLI1_MUSBA|nr:hypothetical protein C4D60_Mb01t05990 [Musa balbisiana]
MKKGNPGTVRYGFKTNSCFRKRRGGVNDCQKDINATSDLFCMSIFLVVVDEEVFSGRRHNSE